MAAARSLWKAQQGGWDHRHLVFLDETGLNTKMTRLYGRAPRSQRCLDHRPHGHWHTNTFIAALRHDRLEAPWMLDGAMNGQAFLVYVSKVLAPTLSEGDIVICDNLSSHKVAGVAEAIERSGATLRYLPAYSPDLNPIEMAFSKLKALVKKHHARSYDELFYAVAEAIESFPAEHCRGFFRLAQYATVKRKCSRSCPSRKAQNCGRDFVEHPQESGSGSGFFKLLDLQATLRSSGQITLVPKKDPNGIQILLQTQS